MSDKKNVLVVDDDPEVLNLMGVLLPALGYSASTASDGEQGLSKIRESRPELVCLDVNMPKKSGVEVLIEMRRDLAIAGIPVVMITAEKYDAAFPAFLQEHPNVRGFLGKPFTGEELSNALLKALSAPVPAAAKGARFRTILVAEDDPAVLQQINLALSGDAQVSLAHDGAQAIEFLRKSIPELLVLDAMMPRYTGIEILRAIRPDAYRCRIPALLLTDFQMKPGDAAMLKAEFPNLRQVVQKPVAAEALRAIIADLTEP